MFTRYAIFYTPAPGPLADFGASWLGWDSASGRMVDHPDVNGVNIAALTQAPRKYGFHGTLKAPFRLAEGMTEAALLSAVADIARRQPVVLLDDLVLDELSSFLALRPDGDTTALNALVADIVTGLDPFRAPLNAAELARRRPHELTARQRDYLTKWGYPFVNEEFRFHLTLTDKLPDSELDSVKAAIAPLLEGCLPSPFPIDGIALLGEDESGFFHCIHRYVLTG